MHHVSLLTRWLFALMVLIDWRNSLNAGGACLAATRKQIGQRSQRLSAAAVISICGCRLLGTHNVRSRLFSNNHHNYLLDCSQQQ